MEREEICEELRKELKLLALIPREDDEHPNYITAVARFFRLLARLVWTAALLKDRSEIVQQFRKAGCINEMRSCQTAVLSLTRPIIESMLSEQGTNANAAEVNALPEGERPEDRAEAVSEGLDELYLRARQLLLEVNRSEIDKRDGLRPALQRIVELLKPKVEI